MARYPKSEVSESLAVLRRHIRPGTTVYTVLRHVSRSGMFRRISLVTIGKRGPLFWDYHVSRVLGYPLNSRKEGVPVGGCGMDMGYHLVNSLSYALHGHISKGEPDSGIPATPKPGHYRAGYSLNHRWL